MSLLVTFTFKWPYFHQLLEYLPGFLTINVVSDEHRHISQKILLDARLTLFSLSSFFLIFVFHFHFNIRLRLFHLYYRLRHLYFHFLRLTLLILLISLHLHHNMTTSHFALVNQSTKSELIHVVFQNYYTFPRIVSRLLTPK